MLTRACEKVPASILTCLKRAALAGLLVLPACLAFAQEANADTVLLPVNRIFYSIPLELRELPLWVPAFDAPPPQDDWNQEQREKHARMLVRAEEANAYLREILD